MREQEVFRPRLSFFVDELLINHNRMRAYMSCNERGVSIECGQYKLMMVVAFLLSLRKIAVCHIIWA